MATDTTSRLATNRLPDDPLVMTAEWRLDASDRRKIDNQILAIQQLVSEGLLNAQIGTRYKVDTLNGVQVNRGDVVTVAQLGTNAVLRADSTEVTRTGSISGIAMANAAPGTDVFALHLGMVSRHVTGLAANNPGPVRVSAAGRCERVDALEEGDLRVGYVNQSGTLVLDFRVGGAAGGGGGGSEAGLELTDDAPENVNGAAAYVGDDDQFAARADHKHSVDFDTPGEITDLTPEAGTADTLLRSDARLAHGERLGGTLHPIASTDGAGFVPDTTGHAPGKVATIGEDGVVTYETPNVTPPDSETGTFPFDGAIEPVVGKGLGEPGTEDTWARGDHKHPLPFYVISSLADLEAVAPVAAGVHTLTTGLYLFLPEVDLGGNTLHIPSGQHVELWGESASSHAGIKTSSANPALLIDHPGFVGNHTFTVSNTGSGYAVVLPPSYARLTGWQILAGNLQVRGTTFLLDCYVDTTVEYARGSELRISHSVVRYVTVALPTSSPGSQQNVGMHNVHQPFTGNSAPLLTVQDGVPFNGGIEMVACVGYFTTFASFGNGMNDESLVDPGVPPVLLPAVSIIGCRGAAVTAAVVPDGGMTIEGCSGLSPTTPWTGFTALTDKVTLRANYAVDGTRLQETPNGHIVRDDASTDWPQTNKIRFEGGEIEQSGGVTIVKGLGTSGLQEGFEFLWNTSTAGTNPGAGRISVGSGLNINNTTNEGAAVQQWLEALTPGMRIRITSKDNKAIFRLFEVLSIVSSDGSFVKLNALESISGGSIPNGTRVWVALDAARALSLRGGTFDDGAEINNPRRLNMADFGEIRVGNNTSGNLAPSASGTAFLVSSHTLGARIHHPAAAVGGGRNITEIGRQARIPTAGNGSFAVMDVSESDMFVVTSNGTFDFLFLSYASSTVGPFGYQPGAYTGPLSFVGQLMIATPVGFFGGGSLIAGFSVRWTTRNTTPFVTVAGVVNLGYQGNISAVTAASGCNFRSVISGFSSPFAALARLKGNLFAAPVPS